ncbi:hypothetical protein OF83DRAFT_1287218 [Amylostereum chailletii]|nr:hypothetical protein OF83DRAFT_1287218 [Amylostereum chailletii]
MSNALENVDESAESADSTEWLFLARGLEQVQHHYNTHGISPMGSISTVELERLFPPGLDLNLFRCALLHQHNTTRPISRLPPEILSHIFNLLEDDIPFNAPFIEAPRRHLDRIAVTHVCGQWRQVALSSATLWSDITFRLGRTWATEMLARAGDSLLSYYVDPDDPVDHEATLSQHLSHIRSLAIHGGAQEIEDIASTCDAPAPALERLQCARDFFEEDDEITSLPMQMFAGWQAPRLHSLELFNIAPPLTSLNNLKHICITFSPDLDASSIPTTQPNCHMFFDFLERMSGLECLELSTYLPSGHLYPSVDRRVKLLNLKDVQLYHRAVDCAAFLRCIEASSLERMYVEFLVSDATDEVVAQSMEGLSHHIRTGEGGTSRARTLRLGSLYEKDHSFEVEVEVWPEPVENVRDLLAPLAVRPSRVPLVHGVFSGGADVSHERVQKILTQVVRTLPLDKMQALILTCVPLWTSPEEAAGFASHIPSTIQHLIFQDCVDPHICRALVAPVDRPPALPHLRTLTFQFVTIVATVLQGLSFEEEVVPLEVVARRHRQYNPLEKVYLWDCNDEPEAFNELESHAAVERINEMM